MKTAKQQNNAFRGAFWATQAREAYIQAKRGGEFDSLVFDHWDDVDVDVPGIVDLAAYAPIPSSNGWEGLGA
jgi:hypothetical protein